MLQENVEMNFSVVMSLLFPIAGMVMGVLQLYFGHRHIQAEQKKKIEKLQQLSAAVQARLDEIRQRRSQRALEVQNSLINLAAQERDFAD
jgi:hypothetical protein